MLYASIWCGDVDLVIAFSMSATVVENKGLCSAVCHKWLEQSRCTLILVLSARCSFGFSVLCL